jgi:hypothetical protein
MKLGDLSANCFRADDKTIFVLNILQLSNFSENLGADNSETSGSELRTLDKQPRVKWFTEKIINESAICN